MALELTVGNLLALGAMGISIVGLLFQHFGVIGALKERLTALETKVELFWGIVEREMVNILHSPHAPERDWYLDRIKAGTITEEEAGVLLHILRQDLDEAKELGTPRGEWLVLALMVARLETKGVK